MESLLSREALFNGMKKQGIVIALILLLVILSLLSENFLTMNNFMLVFRQSAIIGIIALGMTYMLIGGNFDLSVGSMVSLTAVVVVDLHDKIGPTLAIIVGLLIGLIVGAINGTLVGILRMNSLIVTLGMLAVLQGLTLIYSGGSYSVIENPRDTWFSFIGQGYIFGIPMPVWIFGILAIIFGVVLSKTVFGRYVFAVGGNKTTSNFSGISVNMVTFSTFLLTGLTASIGGIMMGSRIMSAQNYIGQGYELQVLAAVILGGTSLFGGSGSIHKTVVGVLILGFISNGLIMLGYPYYTQWLVTWIIIIVAVWLDILAKKGGVSA